MTSQPLFILSFFRLGLVCCFVTNARLEDGIDNMPNELELSISDTKLFLNNTNQVGFASLFPCEKLCKIAFEPLPKRSAESGLIEKCK